MSKRTIGMTEFKIIFVNLNPVYFVFRSEEQDGEKPVLYHASCVFTFTSAGVCIDPAIIHFTDCHENTFQISRIKKIELEEGTEYGYKVLDITCGDSDNDTEDVKYSFEVYG